MPRIACYLERGKQPGRNNLVPIFAFYSTNIQSTRLVKAGNSILAACELLLIQLGRIAL